MPWRWLRWTPWESIKIHSTVRFVSKNDNIGMNAWNDQRATRIIYFSLLENETKICLLDSKISLFLLEKKNAAAFFAASKKWYLERPWAIEYGGARMAEGDTGETGCARIGSIPPARRRPSSPPFARMHLYSFPPSCSPFALPSQTALQSFLSRLGTRTPSSSLSLAFHLRSRIIRLLLSLTLLRFRFVYFFFFPVLLFRAHSRGGRGIPSLPPLRIFSSGTKLVGQEGGGWIWLKFGWNRRSFWNCFDSGGK